LNSLPAASSTTVNRNVGLTSCTEFEEVEALEMILKNKPKVDAVDAKKMTALHVAAGKGNLEILRLLVGVVLDSLSGGERGR
jgi:ankyrin repeat protein